MREQTTTGSGRQLVSMLNDLIHLDFDAIRAYESAIARLSSEESKRRLTEFKGDHERHVTTLQRLVRDLGGDPAEGSDAMRILTQGKVVLMSITGDEGILKAMKVNEDQTNSKYEQALQTRDLTPEVRNVLEQHLSDERRHRAWILAQLGQGESSFGAEH